VARHVYLHVPFCARRCSYCDFSIAVRREVPVEEYLAALDAELRTRFGDVHAEEVDTIYLGGGTPSRLGGEGVVRALDLLRRHFTPTADAEITIEANPEDISSDAARQWREGGVNRLSIGGQSFDDRVLTWMHRTHDSQATANAVHSAREAGITNLSLDLIFALPEALERNFGNDVERLLALEPDHVSVYGLTIEPKTPLGRWVSGGLTVEQPEEGYEADFLTAHRMLDAAGFEHYEVSNYGKPQRRAIHNSAYWSGVPYIGLGPAAHGFDGVTRRWNTRHYAEWRDVALAGSDPREGEELLTPENRVAEQVYLGLRSDGGLDVLPNEMELVRRWVDAGWARLDSDGRLRCTPEGWLRLDALAAALTHHRSR
jgi:oxygen-independent coproporphyrinogen III oxidase